MVRVKYRYLLVNFLYPDSSSKNSGRQTQPSNDIPWVVQFRRPSSDLLNARLLIRLIRNRVEELFGDFGAGLISDSLKVMYLSTATSVAIVRVARAHHRLIWAALTYITRIPEPVNEACVIQVVRVSGTIKKSEEEAVRRARSTILLARRARPEPSFKSTDLLFSNGQQSNWVVSDDLSIGKSNDMANPEEDILSEDD